MVTKALAEWGTRSYSCCPCSMGTASSAPHATTSVGTDVRGRCLRASSCEGPSAHCESQLPAVVKRAHPVGESLLCSQSPMKQWPATFLWLGDMRRSIHRGSASVPCSTRGECGGCDRAH